ncbi:MAG: hypothetical protein GWN76_02635, partial [candidate division Zixibacteria bacterium]|nr:hypothetical protein [candidate division Zixibacteria bacterium]NIR62770.1 hypothetical protein [candidate division Zixibacteria bacterium]NIS44840.1 hypothetical protein [candidate division Zixibacteria bacterium]NIU12933.1 hypothetical protein [candidate division Zixibacteria bacterium]
AGDYQMWIDLTLLDDIDQLNVDTDYTGITDFYLETTTDDMSTITYVDDIQMQTTDITSCKTQGSVDVETLEGEEDCVPDLF